MRESFKGSKLGVHTQKKKKNSPQDWGRISNLISWVSHVRLLKKPVSTKSKLWKQYMQIATVIPLKRLSRGMDTIDRNQHRVLLQGGKAEPMLCSSLRHPKIFPRTSDFWFPLKTAQWGFIKETAIKEAGKEKWAGVLTSTRTPDTNQSILHSTVIIAKTLLSGWQLFDLQLLRSFCPIVWAMSNQSSNAVKSCRIADVLSDCKLLPHS